uniref:Enoyl-CoA delta isomerase 1, mitochondrial n=1 Tax=Sus scrofa TaxID=9823 RepID=A0A8D0RVG2_PIG
MALTAVLRLPARALLRPWALLRGVALGRTEAAAGIRNGARRFGSQHVLVEPAAAAGVAVMKLRNPPVNSLSLELLTELVISLEKLENDKVFRGVILTSDCPSVFSSGLDLRELCGRNPARYAEFWKAVQEMWLRFYLSNLVLVAAINVSGPPPRGRAGLLGVSPRGGARTWPQPPEALREEGGGRGAPQRIREALQVGMVDQVVPEDQLLSTALSVMAKWLAVPDHARQLTKSMIRQATADRLLKQRDADIQNFVSFISKDAIQKSLQTYLEKLKQKKG